MDLPMNRRDFLQSSASGIGLALAGSANITFPLGRSVVQILMTGGPGGTDTWDPKPDAPSDSRSPFSPIATRVPGIFVSELFPRLADRLDQVALIRTLHHSHPPLHETGLQLLQTGATARDQATALPHFGAVAATLQPSSADVPSWVILGGPLGDTGVDLPRGQTSGDLAREIKPTHFPRSSLGDAPARYGESPFGAACYQATRLVAAGVRVVTINMFQGVFDQCSWDMHASSKRLPVSPQDYRDRLGPMFDVAVAALLDDLSSSGQIDRTLVMAGGEVGRTPWFNRHGGRDHWAGCWSMLMAGGGIVGGRVLGQSDSVGAAPVDRAVDPAEVVATVYRSLGISEGTSLGRTDGSIRPISTARPLLELF